MEKLLCFGLLGYLSGSVLYARVFGRLFHRSEIIRDSRDHNPGTANAFQYGGFWCGLLTLWGDLLKGFVPVWLYLRTGGDPVGLGLVLATPVLGHIFPVFFRFRGGKGIATTFGCLLGLLPWGVPILAFAASFIGFSVVLRVSPHFYRTIAAYVVTLGILWALGAGIAVCGGFLAITGAVCLRLHRSEELRERLEVKLLWMR